MPKQISNEELNSLWDSFLARWPREKLDELLTLDTYTGLKGDAEDSDAFCYWLETKTEGLGSIWGGSAFKFGVYMRNDKSKKVGERGRVFGNEYAWYEKNGQNPEDAFQAVKKRILEIVDAAHAGRLEPIEAIDIGDAVKWKIAFLYQDRTKPTIVPIFKRDVLRAASGDKRMSFARYMAGAIEDNPDASVFSIAHEEWKKGNEVLAKILAREDALAYLAERFLPLKEPTDNIAGFEDDAGRQVALSMKGKTVNAFVEPGDWEAAAPGVVLKKRYRVGEPRNSNIRANAPKLDVDHAADSIEFPTKAALIAFCDAYSASKSGAEQESPIKTSRHVDQAAVKEATNKILYGPPGTGKTFKTARLAVELCDGHAPPESEIMTRYEQLRKEERISFSTFHQSYAYEDFIEGLRPESNKDGHISYSVRPGLFKSVCDAARRSQMVKPGLEGKPLKERTFFKMSLGRAHSSEGNQLFNDCIENGQILLGWGAEVDFTECADQASMLEKFKQDCPDYPQPESHARYVEVFKNEMDIDDIVVVSKGNSLFRAIGVVTGPYEFYEQGAVAGFSQKRTVRWLAVFEDSHEVSEIYDRNFQQTAIYKFERTAIKYEAVEALIATPSATVRPFVLIIDEINRANISKVFGELITLLEPDKREGMPRCLTVKLPYSGADFSVPANLHIIGTMNTADRSIALLDTAIRRRFEFEELQPEPDILADVEPGIGIDMVSMLSVLNSRIEYLYDRDHTIGHAFFMSVKSLADLDEVFRRKVIPLLQEYFYDDWAKVVMVLNDRAGRFITSENFLPKGLGSDLHGFEAKTTYKIRASEFSVEAFVNIYQ